MTALERRMVKLEQARQRGAEDLTDKELWARICELRADPGLQAYLANMDAADPLRVELEQLQRELGPVASYQGLPNLEHQSIAQRLQAIVLRWLIVPNDLLLALLAIGRIGRRLLRRSVVPCNRGAAGLRRLGDQVLRFP